MNQEGGGTRPQRRDANKAALGSERQVETRPRLLIRQSEATFGAKEFNQWAGLCRKATPPF